jgi:hypothetical protein
MPANSAAGRRLPVQFIQFVLRRLKAPLQQLQRFGHPGFHRDVLYSNNNLLEMRDLQQPAVSHSIKPSPPFTAGVSLKTGVSPRSETQPFPEIAAAVLMGEGSPEPSILSNADTVAQPSSANNPIAGCSTSCSSV